MPCIIINASAHATIFSVLPDKCIVAHNGTTNPATPSSTPLATVWRSVTGMVAADDDVPSAVKYAGSILRSRRKGFFFATSPATLN